MSALRRAFAAALACAALLLACLFPAGCAWQDLWQGTEQGSGEEDSSSRHPSVEGVPDRFTAEEDKIARFSEGGASAFYPANGWKNGFPFACTWRDSCVAFSEDSMHLTVRQEGDGSFAGAEYRTHANYSYGYYSVSMKAAKCSGVVSSFFTYTNNPWWDEIDIEFLGKDTTGIQLNYYTKGVGGHEYFYELGFDGSEAFHEYGFDWQPGSITWYVDGKAVYRATEDIPTAAGQIMMNVWNGEGENFTEWSGALDLSALPATASYEWVAYSPAGA